MSRYRLMPSYHYETVSGVVPSLIENVGKPLRNYKIYGNTTQLDTPSPSNHVDFTDMGRVSKNLLDYTKITGENISQIDGGLELTSYACNTNITPEIFLETTGLKVGDTVSYACDWEMISGKNNDSAEINGNISFWKKDMSSRVIFYNRRNGGRASTTIPDDFSSENYSNANIYGARTADDGTLPIVHLTKIQLERGDVTTEYEPYAEQTYYVPITVSGVNLMDYKQITSGTVSQIDGGLELTGYNCATGITPEKFLEMTGLKEGDTIKYTCDWELIGGKFTSADNWKGALMFSSKVGGSSFLIRNAETMSFTIPENFNSENYNSSFIYGAIKADDGTLPLVRVTKMHLHRIEVTSDYEPYIGYKEYMLTLPTALGVGDYVDFLNKKLVKGMRAYQITGDETRWEDRDLIYDSYGIVFRNDHMLPELVDGTKTIYCSHWRLGLISDAGEVFQLMTSTYKGFQFKFLNEADGGNAHLLGITNETPVSERLTAFKAWLKQQYEAGTPVTIYYCVENPVEEQPVDELPMVETFKNVTNTVSCRADVHASNIEVQYYRK